MEHPDMNAPDGKAKLPVQNGMCIDAIGSFGRSDDNLSCPLLNG